MGLYARHSQTVPTAPKALKTITITSSTSTAHLQLEKRRRCRAISKLVQDVFDHLDQTRIILQAMIVMSKTSIATRITTATRLRKGILGRKGPTTGIALKTKVCTAARSRVILRTTRQTSLIFQVPGLAVTTWMLRWTTGVMTKAVATAGCTITVAKYLTRPTLTLTTPATTLIMNAVASMAAAAEGTLGLKKNSKQTTVSTNPTKDGRVTI
mmetsp:Transcript_1219/g.2315  ORF Transcript_1219/g.2315 Transcript_1219/m.2315 type:complete len:212 (-) Transcript_1219:325-960(-)